MTNLNHWPIGAQVKTIESLYGAVVIGKDEYGLDQLGKGIVVPAGSLGTIEQHLDDGRILVSFPCDPNRGHTFAEPEKFLRLVDPLVVKLLAELAEVDKSLGEFYCQLPDGSPFYLDHGVHLLTGQLQRAEAEVERLRAERRWIPVSERLPETTMWYLIAICRKDKPDFRWVDFKIFDKTAGTFVIGGAEYFTVTHWMPLPAGPSRPDNG